jgi:hypothetical protein
MLDISLNDGAYNDKGVAYYSVKNNEYNTSTDDVMN